MDNFHPEVHEIEPFKNFNKNLINTDGNANAVVTAIEPPILS